jgi:uroporphyrinogen III methyltransferase/synthase
MNDAQVPFEIVPGITAGIAAAAYAGIPVTHPGIASSVTFVNGRDDPASADTITDWRALAKVGGTIVVYNGLKLLPAIASAMTDAGLPGEIPAAAIRAGTRVSQKTVVATLETLEHEAILAGLARGVTVVIGWSVLLRDELAWFDRRPLFGKRITVAADIGGGEGEGLTRELEDLGADVIQVPPPQAARLDLAPIRDDLLHVTDYGWLVFTSSEAVTLFWEQLLILGRDTRALAGVKLCAVGSTTAATLLDHGVTVDILQERFEAPALLELLAERSDVVGATLLYVCDEADNGALPSGLFALGANVVRRPAYRSVVGNVPAERIRRRLERGTVDLVVVTSPAAASHYLRTVGEELLTRAPVAVPDEATAAVLQSAGGELIQEPRDSGTGLQGFVATIVQILASE